MDKKATYKVKNIGTANIFYNIPDLNNLRRSFVPGEEKTLTGEELERLTYIPGGYEILRDYLQVDKAVLDELEIPNEPEDFMTEAQVTDLLLNGTNDQLLDALYFAKPGVIDLIKKIAVETRLNDVVKRNIIKDKLNYDVTAVLALQDEEKAERGNIETAKTERLVKPQVEETERRTAPPKYNIVSK